MLGEGDGDGGTGVDGSNRLGDTQRHPPATSKLRKSVSDPARLRILTGDWFCDARAQRHRHHLGSDLVRASIRRRRRPRGAEDLECGPSLGELEAIREPLVEEKEDEDGAAEPEESPPTEDVQEDAEPQGPENLEKSPASPARVSPQNGHRSPSSLLTTSSSVSSLSSSTLSGSLMSLYSEGELGSVAVRGCVQFSLRYDPAKKELQVHVLRCRELAEAKKQRSDPYIKTYLLPDKSNRSKRKTTVRKRSLDPIFNETLKYKLEKRDLQGRTLNLSVWHHDSLGRNLFLGEVEIALGTWDWANTSPEWFNLQPRAKDLAEACAEFTLWHHEAFAKRQLGGIRLSLGTAPMVAALGLWWLQAEL
ncbi:hypothetical protein A306_00000248 [Columba livia]|uniref:C2 domain-containing protein n=1 Tax=Columba livia TaxID=8932 RepID=A0A2I0LK62_COLLI|nr:hypothetical protein A306_00000248 [Columba livia]